jgi:hypothetical protein
MKRLTIDAKDIRKGDAVCIKRGDGQKMRRARNRWFLNNKIAVCFSYHGRPDQEVFELHDKVEVVRPKYNLVKKEISSTVNA